MKKQVAELYIKSAEKIEAVVREFAETTLVPAKIKRLGLAVSGGADSVALFHLMLPLCREMDITPVVLHLNHGLRAESEEEAVFVEELASSHHIQYAFKTLDLINRPKENKSLEMAARDERILFYADCMETFSLNAIATGHHADDVCETLLLRIARGAGIAGLAGMRPVSSLKPEGNYSCEIKVVRPLLQIAPCALREWLKKRDLLWHDDLSNLDTSIPRNNVRHNIIPFLRKNLNPDIESRLCHSAATLREDEEVLNGIAEEKLNSISYNGAILVAALMQLSLAIRRRALRLWLFQHSLAEAAGFQTVNDLLARCNGTDTEWTVQLTKKVLAKFDGELLDIYNPTTSEILPEFELVTDGTFLWGDFDIKIERSHGIEAKSQGVGIYPSSCSLDAGKLKGKTILVRQRREGDRISPTGLKGSKKVKDILIDAKVPRHERDAMPIITCGDEILWIPGYRISKKYALSSDTAKSIHITVTKSL